MGTFQLYVTLCVYWCICSSFTIIIQNTVICHMTAWACIYCLFSSSRMWFLWEQRSCVQDLPLPFPAKNSSRHIVCYQQIFCRMNIKWERSRHRTQGLNHSCFLNIKNASNRIRFITTLIPLKSIRNVGRQGIKNFFERVKVIGYVEGGKDWSAGEKKKPQLEINKRVISHNSHDLS